MAISSYNVQLMYKATDVGTYEKLVDIKEYPDLGGSPEQLETTTLSDSAQTFINGIQSMSTLEFTYNYTEADFDKVDALDDGTDKNFALYFGPAGTGEQGIFEWKGTITTWVVGGGVNAVVDAKIAISASTVIAKQA